MEKTKTLSKKRESFVSFQTAMDLGIISITGEDEIPVIFGHL